VPQTPVDHRVSIPCNFVFKTVFGPILRFNAAIPREEQPFHEPRNRRLPSPRRFAVATGPPRRRHMYGLRKPDIAFSGKSAVSIGIPRSSAMRPSTHEVSAAGRAVVRRLDLSSRSRATHSNTLCKLARAFQDTARSNQKRTSRHAPRASEVRRQNLFRCSDSLARRRSSVSTGWRRRWLGAAAGARQEDSTRDNCLPVRADAIASSSTRIAAASGLAGLASALPSSAVAQRAGT